MMDTSQFCFSVNFITYLDFGSLFHPRLIALHDHLKWDIQSIAELGHVNKTAHSNWQHVASLCCHTIQ